MSTPATHSNLGPHIRCDVTIIGGGIVGLSTALELQSRGKQVAVIDRDLPRERASFGNAGVISRGSILAVANSAIWRKAARYAANRDPALRIRYASFPHLVRWLTHFIGCCNDSKWRRSAQALNPLVAAAYDHHMRLAQLTGAQALIACEGYLQLFRSPAAFAAAQLEREILSEAGVKLSILQSAELRELEPALAPLFSHALLFPQSGSIDSPGQLIDLYRQTFCGRGGAYIAGEARGIEYGSEAVTIHLGERSVTAPRAVIAAGAWSTRLLAPFKYRIPFLAERGYHAHFAVRSATMLNRPFYDVDGSYGAARMGNTIRVLSGIELARPDDPADFSQLDAITPEARKVLPLAEMVPGSRWMGSRPSTADSLPVIGPAPGYPRVLLAFGHGHIGLSTGPITGRIIADLVSGQTPPIPIEAFSIARFAA